MIFVLIWLRLYIFFLPYMVPVCHYDPMWDDAEKPPACMIVSMAMIGIGAKIVEWREDEARRREGR